MKIIQLLFLFIFSVSLIQLQYSEAIENDGLVLCESFEEMEDSQTSDNDHETVQSIVDLCLLQTFKLPIINSFLFESQIIWPGHSLKSSYLSDVLKPPILS